MQIAQLIVVHTFRNCLDLENVSYCRAHTDVLVLWGANFKPKCLRCKFELLLTTPPNAPMLHGLGLHTLPREDPSL